jgi:signal transduction histidine kinase
MKFNSRILLIFFFLTGMLLIANNTSYYWLTKKSFTESISDKMKSTAEQIRISIEHSEEGSFYVEDVIGENLRSVALFAKSELDPHIDKVTNEQLLDFKTQAGIDGVSLMQKIGNDIVVTKSSEPMEIGLPTKDLGYWFTAFNQLYNYHTVMIPEGKKLLNFWTGPYEVPASGASELSKFGYYYDGTTDYIICTFVNARRIEVFKNITGANTIIKKTMGSNQDIVEIAGLNANTFGTTPKVYKDAAGSPFISVYDQPVLFGQYTIIDANDVDNVNKAKNSNQSVSIVTKWGDKPILKTFVPVPVKQLSSVQREVSYVITIVSDYKAIQDTLNSMLFQLAALILFLTVFSFIFLYFAFRHISRTRETAVQTTQELYIQNVDMMFAAIRGQRHDFLNHVQTIYALLSHGKREAQLKYMKELIEEIDDVTDIIRIGHPAIAALIQAKIAVAIRTKITFHYHFTGLDGLTLGIKSVDIVKIIGNLIDNAFDEANKFPPEQREVLVNGWSEANSLFITVTNPFEGELSEADKEKIFEIGFTTKSIGDHHGVGLAVVKGTILKYKGTIDVYTEDGTINFQVSIHMQ